MNSFQRCVCLAVVSLAIHSSANANDGQADLLCGPAYVREVEIAVSELPEGTTQLTWLAESSFWTDLVRGSLSILASSHGDFAAATELCLLDDIPDVNPVLVHDPDLPSPGDGFWYLVRTDQHAGCPVLGANDYNETDASQVGFRNSEIRMSGRDCSCYYPCNYP